jgi:chromosome segregation ATPase
MSDETTKTPDQQADAPEQQASANPTTDWESRFKGLQKKFNVLMETKGELDNQLAEERMKREDFEKQLASLSNEKDSLTTEKQRKIDELTGQLTQREEELSKLSKMQLKVEVANELGHPELLQLMNAIPDSDNREDVEGAMKTILGFTKAQIEQRERQLTEGLMPGEATAGDTPMPTTEEGWVEMIDELPLGSTERDKAMDSYFKWLRE